MGRATVMALLMVSFARADELSITARVDTPEVALNEQMLLEVSVTADKTNLPEPKLPSLPNFQVYSSGRSQNVAISNGRIQSSVTYTYVLVPRFVGETVIGPISVEMGGMVYETDPISVKVLRPSGTAQLPGAAPAPGPPGAPGRAAQPSRRGAQGGGAPDLFVSAKVDKARSYVGEQVTLFVRFYTAVPLLSNPEYMPPTAQGFLTEDLPPNRNGQTNELGRTYYYTEIRTALFPLEPGTLTITPAVVRAQIRQDMALDPFAPDFFQKFFSQGQLAGQTRELRTEPIKVQVLSLPEAGKPENFTGAVGRYRVKGTLSKQSVQVGDPVDLVVTVEGEGNLKTAGELKLPGMDQFQVYDAASSMNLEKKDDQVRSSKVYKTVLVPRVSGALTVPPVAFSSYDPKSGAYTEAKTPPMEVKVAPSAAPTATPMAPTRPGGVVAVSSDIRHLRQARPAAWSAALRDLARARWPHGLPVLAFALCLGVTSWKKHEASDPRAARHRRALSRARDRVAESEKAQKAGKTEQAATLLAMAVEGYLSDKLGPEAAGLPLQKTLDLFAKRHPTVPADRLKALKSLWDDLQGRRFAPKTADQTSGSDLARAALAQLDALDKEMRS